LALGHVVSPVSEADPKIRPRTSQMPSDPDDQNH
jgi:hypothetical protein